MLSLCVLYYSCWQGFLFKAADQNVAAVKPLLVVAHGVSFYRDLAY